MYVLALISFLLVQSIQAFVQPIISLKDDVSTSASLAGQVAQSEVQVMGKAATIPVAVPLPIAQQPPVQLTVNVATPQATANVATAIANQANSAAVAASAANSAANAAQAAALAANAAQAAAVTANTAANAAATAHTAADAAASANTAVKAAARANIAANAAVRAVESAPSQPAVAATPAVGATADAFLPKPVVPASRFWSSSQWLWQLITGLTLAMVVKAFCIVGNILVQISPMPQVVRWDARKCTGEADAAPYVSIAFGGCQWCFYGMFAWLVTQRSGFLILVQSNILGAILGTYYLRTFYVNCRSEVSLASLQKYLSAVTSLALLQVCAMGVLPAERALFLTGLVSSFCSFIGATSVLVTVPAVIRTKDSRSIPGPYAIANLGSSVVWSLCGYLLDDPLVMIPNLFSSCCSATSLGLKAYYPSDFFATGSDKPDNMSTAEEAIDTPAKELEYVGKKDFRKSTEFTPLKLHTSKMDTFVCVDKMGDPIKTPALDASTHLLEKLAEIEPLPIPMAAGDGCGTGGTF